MRWFVLAVYIATGVGAALGSYSVRPSQGWGALAQVPLWPMGVGFLIAKTAVVPDDAGAE